MTGRGEGALVSGPLSVAWERAKPPGGFVMKWCLGLCATAFLAGLLAVPCRGGEAGDYLTKDGNLKEALTFKTVLVSH
jgi:hypothetical protein